MLRTLLKEKNNMLELYQTEFCRYCEHVRQVIDELQLNVVSHMSDFGSPRRDTLLQLGGKAQVPFLVDTADPEHPVMMYESADIIAYLRKTYGKNI